MALPPAAKVVMGIGALALTLVVINQATAPRLDPALERAGALGSILAVLLMLVAFLWERVQPDAAARAALQGREGVEISEELPDALLGELGWGSGMLLTATPAAVVLLTLGERTLLRRGLLGDSSFSPGPICRRAQERQRPISLVDLRLYPGRDEFEPILPGLPSVVVQPVGRLGLLVVGGWSARCFDRSDLLWIEGWARRLTVEWGPVFGASTEPEASGGSSAEPERR